ncbi:MAG TPA: TetR/AcrR family transcriptional regulator [Solirubrobacteraceae bacterium]|nr:TetR/AcrR family transcriptional regulator [Solirubrobacteraceae bacterium]
MAVELIEREGAAALSMRKVAAAVGVEAMSLYNHVENKDDMLDGITGVFFTKIEMPELSGDWTVDLRALADAFRAAARAYPNAATLALTREAVSDSGIAMTAAVLAVLRRAGFEPDQAVQVLRASMSFLIGALLRELASAPTIGVEATAEAERVALLQASPVGVIAEAAEPLAKLDFDREYDFGMQLMLRSIEHVASGS